LVINPQDPSTRKLTEDEAQAALTPVRAAYESAGRSQALEIKVEPLESNIPTALENWLRSH
jgi:hypothetical protein